MFNVKLENRRLSLAKEVMSEHPDNAEVSWGLDKFNQIKLSTKLPL